MSLTYYDISTDERKELTQELVDRMFQQLAVLGGLRQYLRAALENCTAELDRLRPTSSQPGIEENG